MENEKKILTEEDLKEVNGGNTDDQQEPAAFITPKPYIYPNVYFTV